MNCDAYHSLLTLQNNYDLIVCLKWIYTRTAIATARFFVYATHGCVSGTTQDRVLALTVMFEESPIHNLHCFETLLNITKKDIKRETIKGILPVDICVFCT